MSESSSSQSTLYDDEMEFLDRDSETSDTNEIFDSFGSNSDDVSTMDEDDYELTLNNIDHRINGSQIDFKSTLCDNIISITKDNIKCLVNDEYINEQLIDFYLEYIRSKAPIEIASKTFIFPTAFFSTMMGPERIGRYKRDYLKDNKYFVAAYESVQNFTTQIIDEEKTKIVNIFDYDFVVVPILREKQWILSIICFSKLLIDNQIRDNKIPCIIFMDSFGKIDHSTFTKYDNLLKFFIQCEIQDINNKNSPLLILCNNLKTVNIRSPKQIHECDSGLYLLQNFQSFYENYHNFFGLERPQSDTHRINDFNCRPKRLETCRIEYEASIIKNKRKEIFDSLKEINERERNLRFQTLNIEKRNVRQSTENLSDESSNDSILILY